MDMKTELKDFLVSTVEINFGGDGFETLVVKRRGKVWDWSGVYQKTWDTKEEARAGHAEAVALFQRIEG